MKQLVREHMSTKLETLGPDSTLQDAMSLEMRNRIRHIPIVEGAELVGILTDRDLRRAMPSMLSGTTHEEYKRVMSETPVSKIMTRRPMTVSPDATLKEAGQILCDNRFGGLPVVDGTKLVGIITQTDILRVLLKLLE